MKIINKEGLIKAMANAASGVSQAISLVEFIKKAGREVCLIDTSSDSWPKMTKTKFLKNRKAARAIAQQLGVGEIPNTWEEFEELLKICKKDDFGIKTFRLDLPQDWNISELALVVVPEIAIENYLPGNNLVGFSRQDKLDVDGPSLYCRALFYTDTDISEFWLGVQAIQAAVLAKKDIEFGTRNVSVKELEARMNEMMGGPACEYSDKRIEWQIESFFLQSCIIDKMLGGMLGVIIESFGVKESMEKTGDCVHYLINELEKCAPLPQGKTDTIVRDVSVIQSVVARAWPNEAIKLILQAPGAKAMPKPYIQT